VSGSGEHGNESSYSIGEDFLGHLSDYQLLKDSASWSQCKSSIIWALVKRRSLNGHTTGSSIWT
jgi:hypothetical protein